MTASNKIKVFQTKSDVLPVDVGFIHSHFSLLHSLDLSIFCESR